MESVNRKVILTAVVMALITSFLVYVYIKKTTSKPEVIEYINVFVATKTLPAKHKVEETDVQQVKVTGEYLNAKAVLNKADIVGKRLKDRIIEGEQILSDRLLDDNNLNLAFNIPEGKRAVSINVSDQIAVGNLLRPGDYVDIVASFDKEEVEEGMAKITYPRVTKIIIQNVQILALGQDQVVSGEKLAESPKTVTLAVSPGDMEKLVFASEYASLRLALRGTDDNQSVNTQGAIRNDMASERGTKTTTK